MQKYKMWINGNWVDAISGKTFRAINPAIGEETAEVPLGDKADVDKAVAAAKNAFPVWSRTPLEERCQIALKISAAIIEHAQELGRIETMDHGMPPHDSVPRIIGTTKHFTWVANNAQSFMSNVIPWAPNTLVYMQHEPIGVAALIIPWNYPFTMLATKLAPAMIMGNTCVVKPPSTGSLSALKLAEIMEKVGLPPGTVNIVTGPGGKVGAAMASHPDVNLVAFTGSSKTGKEIMSMASSTIKRIQMELGGKNPIIILDDADVDAAVAREVGEQTWNAGQICGAPGRFYVHAKIYDEFVDKFVDRMKKVVVGDPTNGKTEMGPLVSLEHRDRVEAYIQSGVDEGAKLVLGGKRPTQPPLDKGYYVMPTVFTHVKQNMKIAREEIFGPVAVIMEPFTSDEEVIKLANDNNLGLFAHVWSRDIGKTIRFSNELCAGQIKVNDFIPGPAAPLPWGGFKESGFGKDHHLIGLEDYTQVKTIAIDLT